MIIGFMLFFVMRALGELLLSNLNYWSSWVIACVADIVAITAYVQYFNPGIAVWIPAFITAVALLFLNLQRVRAFGETEFWFAIIKIVAILGLIVVGLILVFTGFTSPTGTEAHLANLWEHGGFFPTGFGGFILGFQLGNFAFNGIELVGTTVAETRNPHRNPWPQPQPAPQLTVRSRRRAWEHRPPDSRHRGR